MYFQSIHKNFAKIKLQQAGSSLEQLHAQGKVEISPGVYLTCMLTGARPTYQIYDHTQDGGDMESHVPAKVRPTLPCLQGTVNRQYEKDTESEKEVDARRQSRFREMLLA